MFISPYVYSASWIKLNLLNLSISILSHKDDRLDKTINNKTITCDTVSELVI